MGERVEPVKPRVCPYCETALSGDAAEWRGLSVDWATRDVRYEGRHIQGIGPTGTRFLFALVEAQGGNVRMAKMLTLCGDETGPNNVSVQMTKLRFALRGLPFRVVCAPGKGYRLEGLT